MARLAVTVGLLHDSRKPVVVTGPEVPPAAQRDALRELQKSPAHPDYCQVEIWTSDAGMQRRKKFAKPGAVKPAKPQTPSDPPPAEDAKKPAKKK